MAKIGYRKIKQEYYERYYSELQKEIQNINISEIKYRILTEAQEVEELMVDIFDEFFWKDYIGNDSIKESMLNKESFILFEIKGIPCALALISDIQEYSKRELYQLDVEDYIFERGNGIGPKVVELLNEHIYPNEKIYGYAVSEAAKFWSRIANNYDHDIFESMREEHLENGGEEDELFECDGLMYFSL